MRGKHFKRIIWDQRRIIVTTVSVVVLLSVLVVSTVAWLTAHKDPVVNKFVGSQLEITLSPEGTAGSYKMIPGITHDLGEKAPVITVEADSVECYLFAVLVEDWGVNRGSDTTDKSDYYYYIDGLDQAGTFMCFNQRDMQDVYGDTSSYSVVYYKTNGKNYIETSEANQSFKVIKTLTVPEERTKHDVAPETFNGSCPKFMVEAYSIQTLGLKPNGGSEEDVKAAWELVKAAIKSGNTKEVVLK